MNPTPERVSAGWSRRAAGLAAVAVVVATVTRAGDDDGEELAGGVWGGGRGVRPVRRRGVTLTRAPGGGIWGNQ